jgi:hypothetical protein
MTAKLAKTKTSGSGGVETLHQAIPSSLLALLYTQVTFHLQVLGSKVVHFRLRPIPPPTSVVVV